MHPGYGFLSEKSSFARAVAEAGVVFIGPPPDVLDAFGDKMKARHVALSAGTSPVPGHGRADRHRHPRGRRAREGDRRGRRLPDRREGGRAAAAASACRSCRTRPASSARSSRARDRGKASFADARVYLERYVSQPRHIEVQVFCDTHGQAFALGERECSVQRRHQKIVEESPSPASFFAGEAGEKRRKELYEAALRVVKKVGYVGAGTCEFIADDAGNLFFLEVNARLQVEHPVTEMVTGLDLVELQLRVATRREAARPLDGHAHGPLDRGAHLRGGPEQGVHPEARADRRAHVGGRRPGEVQSRTLRIESGVVAGSKVTPFYDPMIAKVVAWGETREAAIAELDRALEGTTLAPATTNLSFLRKVLASEEFRAGRYDTKFAEVLAKRP